jgi:hypothetical protein
MSSIAQTTRNAGQILYLRRLSPLGKTLVAVGAYAVWTIVTWLLEGRIQTLLRPEATMDRIVYTGIANVLVGTILALWLVRELVASDFVSREQLGFRSPGRTLGAVLVAGFLGIAVYLVQQPPSTDPVVVANAFAQVLPVSIAEIVICWVVVGGSVAALLRTRGTNRYLANSVALVAASLLFGVYHLAHSPPFNTLEMIGLLTLVSVGTGLFYFAGHSVYGALVFHNFLALFGVTTALADAGQLGTYQDPAIPLLVTAVVSLIVLVGVERVFVRDAATTPSDAPITTN